MAPPRAGTTGISIHTYFHAYYLYDFKSHLVLYCFACQYVSFDRTYSRALSNDLAKVLAQKSRERLSAQAIRSQPCGACSGSLPKDTKKKGKMSGTGLPHAHLLLSGQTVDLTAVSLSNSEPLHELAVRPLEIAVQRTSSTKVQSNTRFLYRCICGQ